MHPQLPPRPGQTPGMQFLKLCLLVFIGMILTIVVSCAIIIATQGIAIFTNPKALANIQTDVGLLRWLLVIQQIFVFAVPAFVFARTEGFSLQKFYDFKSPKITLLFFVFAIMCCSFPLLSLVTEWNASMHLPAFLKDLEAWMLEKENDAAKTTELLLEMKTVVVLLVNILVVAVTPAICEELIFRGALQGVFVRLIKNQHVAIWTTAIVFSAIHLQFFGFLPRMLLGAAFGYIYFWTKSIWYPIFAHFLNNGYAVVITYYFQKNNLPIKEADQVSIAWYGYIISAILTLALFKILKDRSAQKQSIENA